MAANPKTATPKPRKTAPSKKLVVVESPTKAKTLERYLGTDYAVKASFGHIRDLPKNKIGVDTERNFEPDYVVPEGSKKAVTALKTAHKKAAGVHKDKQHEDHKHYHEHFRD